MKSQPDGQPDTAAERYQQRLLRSPVDRVEVKLGRTVRTDEMEFSRIDIAYETTIRLDETPQQALLRARKTVLTRMKAEMEDVQRQIAEGEI